MRHVFEEIVAGKVNIMNDLAKVFVEIRIGEVLQVVKGVLRNVSLPLKLTYPQKSNVNSFTDVESFKNYLCHQNR